MLGLEETSSENVARIRETEDGVNRALLMSAARGDQAPLRVCVRA